MVTRQDRLFSKMYLSHLPLRCCKTLHNCDNLILNKEKKKNFFLTSCSQRWTDAVCLKDFTVWTPCNVLYVWTSQKMLAS